MGVSESKTFQKTPPERIRSLFSLHSFGFEAVLRRLNLGLTFDLKIDCFHIPVSIAINDSLTNEPIFIENHDPEQLIEEFIAELNHRQENIFREVWNKYPVMDESSLPKVRERWIKWVNQVPVFGFNSEKYDLNLIKEYFIKTPSDMTDITVAKKDNSYMFLTTFMFMLRIISLQVLAMMAGAKQMVV